jgi:hypothetical protein
MERENPCGAKDYLTTPVVAKILRVSCDVLDDIVENGVARPLREPMLNKMKLWGPEDILRAFLGLRLAKEFKIKYGNGYDEYMYSEVRRDILSAKRIRGREILNSEEWGTVVKRATKKGMHL